MIDNKKARLNNTIELVSKVLEKNKEKDGVKESYEDIQKLKAKRDIKEE